jgi:hypothetical protein
VLLCEEACVWVCFGKWSWREFESEDFERRQQVCRFCPNGKYLIALGVYRIIHCISFVCLASHRGNYLMFGRRLKKENCWLSSEGLSRLRESAESVGVLQYEIDCELIVYRLRADCEIVVRLIMHIINIHVQYGRWDRPYVQHMYDTE